jgi:hypothetical protein
MTGAPLCPEELTVALNRADRGTTTGRPAAADVRVWTPFYRHLRD